MIYKNPVISGFYPDPSVCRAGDKYYLVCSSFQYFPGVPLFESEDLVNWKQIGHVLTRKSQVDLQTVPSSGGVFAPTIRYNDGHFYMVTTNDTTHKNFYVMTDDIYGEWSDPVIVDQDGIDPSLLFENGKAYFLSNGSDDEGKHGVVQCEIDIMTGKKLSPSKCIWQGSGGRYLESPHMYKIGEYYYLTAAEGGTEYGHMVTYARSSNVWGPFEGYAKNPVVTNRNKAPNIIQGIGHADLVQGKDGEWHFVALGFRQIHIWQPFHTLGREVFLLPVSFDADGWFTCGDGTAEGTYSINGDFEQNVKKKWTFENTDWNIDWCMLRCPDENDYELFDEGAVLHGGGAGLDSALSPTFIMLRQKDFCFAAGVDVKTDRDEAGFAVYHCETEHYEAFIRRAADGFEVGLRKNIGGVKQEFGVKALTAGYARLIIEADALEYRFYAETGGEKVFLGAGASKYLSSEVCGGFTGNMIGIYASGSAKGIFEDLEIIYE